MTGNNSFNHSFNLSNHGKEENSGLSARQTLLPGWEAREAASGTDPVTAGKYGNGNLCGTLSGRRPVLLTETDLSAYPLRDQRLKREPGECLPCLRGYAGRSWSDCLPASRANTTPFRTYREKGLFHGKAQGLQRRAPGWHHTCRPFIFFMRTCYNGIYSVNRKGRLGNLRYGQPRQNTGEELIHFNHKLLQGVVILDGTTAGRKIRGEKSVFYFDPPYKPSTRPVPVPPTCRTTSMTTAR